jgi:hypothetical protein
MSISSAGSSSFLTANQLNSAASNGTLQPGQMVLVPASMLESGQIDTTQFQPISNYSSSTGQSSPITSYNPGGPEIPYTGYGQQGGYYPYSQGSNPFNNGLPMGPGPEIGSYPGGYIGPQQVNGSPVLGGQTEPTLPTSTGTPTTTTGQGQTSSFVPMIAQIMQMMISMLTQMMSMMQQNSGTTSGDVTGNNNANGNTNNNNNQNNNGGQHHCGGH